MNPLLKDSFRRRRITQQQLADKIFSSRSHVSQVLNNKPGRGYQTRHKLAHYLTNEELQILGWNMFHVEENQQSK